MERKTKKRKEAAVQTAKILLDAANGFEALSKLYKAKRLENKKFSLGFLCRQAGISSTGYLSDVMNGKRRLALKYRFAISRAFDLVDEEASVLRLLLALDRTRGEDRKRLEHRLQYARKALQRITPPISDKAESLFFALDVFAVFGLLGNSTKVDDLLQYFGEHRKDDIQSALDLLVKRGLLTYNSQANYELKQSQVVFNPGEDEVASTRFIELGLADTQKHLSLKFKDSKTSWFTSQVVSVRLKEFRKFLERFRLDVEEHLNEIEKGDADSVVRFNLQVYPVFHKDDPGQDE